MAFVSRLGGAILAVDGESYFLVGDLKEPTSFIDYGFVTPEIMSGKDIPYIKLSVNNNPHFPPQKRLYMNLHGDVLAQKLYELFVIRRNGSVSERLWNLVTENCDLFVEGESSDWDGRWLAHTPLAVWEAVRDSVLRC